MNNLVRLFWLTVILFFFIGPNKAQTVANYSFTPSNSVFSQITGGTQVSFVAGLNDGYSNGIPIGFTFYYNGQDYSTVSASTNGFIVLGQDFGSSNNFTNNLANGTGTGSPRPIVAPLWDNLLLTNAADVSYLTSGYAPNRVFTLQWLNVKWTSGASASNISFQVKLSEADGKIEFLYRPEVGALASPSASIGITNIATGTKNFLCLTSTGNVATDTSTITETNILNSKPADGQSYAFVPKFLLPNAPNNITYTNITTTSITVNWIDNSNSETYFLIYASEDNSNFSLIGNLPSLNSAGTGGSYQRNYTGLIPGKTYYFKIYACNEGSAPTNFAYGSQGTLSGLLSGVKTICPTGCDYTSIGLGCNDIRTKGIDGNLIFELTNTYNSNVENYPLSFGDLLTSAANTLTIRPAANVTQPIIFTSAGINTLEFNGTNFLTIEGKKGGSGTAEFIQISNLASSGSAINFINGSGFNTINNCRIAGKSLSATSGVINFLGTNKTVGNNNNSIYYCSIKDTSGTPIYGIYSSGNATYGNLFNTLYGNKFSNFYNNSNATYGINLGAGNDSWFIGANHFFQTSARSLAANTAGAIYISSGSSYVIYGNYFGGSAENCGGTPYTLSGNGYMAMVNLNLSTASSCVVQANTFQNFYIQLTGNFHYFLNLWNGAFNVAGNIIGNDNSNSNIRFNSSGSNVLLAPINLTDGTAYGDINIESNTIGSISISGTGTVNFRGVNVTLAVPSLKISSNTIGSLTVPKSIVDSTSCVMYGILGPATASENTIENNVISNISAFNPSSTTRICGIYMVSSGSFNVKGNTIKKLYTLSTTSGSGSGAAITGILQSSSGLDQVCQDNKISELIGENTATLPTITIYGVYFTGSNAGTNVLANNYVHCLQSLNTGQANIIGLFNGNSGALVYNNRIRLGVDINGNAITLNHQFFGIHDQNNSNSYYHNSIYITGNTGPSGTGNSYAFYNATSTTGTRLIVNNIFSNHRTNTTGTGKHYSIYLTTATLTGLTLDNNIYYAPGLGGIMGRFNTLEYTNLDLWRSATFSDLNSGYGNANFNLPNSTNSELKVQSPTPAEGAGKYLDAIELETDFEGDWRSSNTPSDIGADAGNYTPLDIFPPSITYTPITNTASTLNRTLVAHIIDSGSGVNISGSLQPRIWYRRSFPSVSAWVSSVGTLSSGSSKNGIWTFTIDYSLIGTPAIYGHRYQYYVVAQDSAPVPNVFYSPNTGASHTNVNNQVSAPNPPSTYSIVINLPTNISVGSGQTFTTLTGNGGLFAAINSGALAGNTTATIVSDITEPGLISLTNVGMSGYKLLIKPDNSPRVLSGALTTATTSMIYINGACGVTFDGGPTRLLTLRNSIGNVTNTTTTTTIRINSGKNDTIKNCIIEGNQGNSSYPIIYLVTSSGTETSTELYLKNNLIRPAFNDTLQAAISAIIINSSTGNLGNSTICGNEIYDFSTYGIYIANAGNNITIGDPLDSLNGNKFYHRSIRGTLYAVLITSGSGHTIANNSFYNYPGVRHTSAGYGVYVSNNVNNIKIAKNSFGGSSATRGGQAYWLNSVYYGILFAGGNIANSYIENNIFGNIYLTGNNLFTGIYVSSGKVNIKNNRIGGKSNGGNPGDTISCSYNFFGARILSTSPTTFENNIISDIKNYGSSYLVGASIEAGVCNIKNNIISNMFTYTTTLTNVDYACIGIRLSSSTSGNNLENNLVYNLYNESNANLTTVTGIAIMGNVTNNTVHRNRIYNLVTKGVATGTNSPTIRGIYATVRSNSTFYNNQVTITNNIAGTMPRIRGIEANNSGGSNYFYHNSVYIGGVSYGVNNSSAFYRNTSGTTAAYDLVNNIFYNERSGGGKHFSLSANSNSNLSQDNNLYVNMVLNATVEYPINTSKSLNDWNTVTGNPSGNLFNTNTDLNSTQFFPLKNVGDLSSNSCRIADNGAYTSITTDYANVNRGNPADIGSVEFTSVLGKPTIVTQPVNKNISCSPPNVKFSIVASGYGLLYQWQENRGNGWYNLENIGVYSGVHLDTLTITNPTSDLNTYKYRCYIKGTCNPQDTSNIVTLTVSNTSTWLGSVSTAWAVGANWSCGAEPTPTTDAVVNNVTNLPIISTNNRTCHNLTIGTGASVTLNNTSSELNVYGTINLTGTLNTTQGRIIFAGSKPQTMPALNYQNISINNDSDVTLLGQTSINGNLHFSKGNLLLDKYKLSLIGTTSNITGAASNGKYIITNDTGALRIQNVGNGGRTGLIEFPIGANQSSYTPIFINNSGTSDHFDARVIQQVYPNYNNLANPIGTAIASNVVNKSWIVKEAIQGGSNAQVQIQWNVADEVLGFNRLASYISKYNGSVWVPASAASALGSNPYTQTINGVDSFHVFGIGSGGMLPVQLLKIAATLDNKDAIITWQTASEINSHYFDIERSFDGFNYNKIGRVNAAGNSQITKSYSYADLGISENNFGSNRIYYRLNMHDLDGQNQYSPNVFVELQKDVEEVFVHPNPFNEEINIYYQSTVNQQVNIEVKDLYGKTIYSTQFSAINGSNVFGLNQSIISIPGLYFISINNGQNCRVFKILKN
jgi:hypothetical protein